MMNEQTLLVVDDEAAIRDMLATSLELAGFRVLLAEDAMQALVQIADHAPIWCCWTGCYPAPAASSWHAGSNAKRPRLNCR